MWTVSVTNGRASADPVRLNVDLWRLEHSLGFDKNGVFYYSVNPTVADLYVATIDPASLKVTTAPQPVAAEDGGTHGPGAWSPDGRLLAYLVSNEAASVSFSGVIIRSLETGDQRVLTPAALAVEKRAVVPRRTFVTRRREPTSRGVKASIAWMRSPVRWPSFVRDRPTRRTCSVRHCRPTERRCTSEPLMPKGNSLVMARDLRSGAEREVSRFSGQVGWPSLSRDGKQLAFAVSDPCHSSNFDRRAARDRRAGAHGSCVAGRLCGATRTAGWSSGGRRTT